MADMDAGAEVFGEGFGRVDRQDIAQRRGVGAHVGSLVDAMAVRAGVDGDHAAIGDRVSVGGDAEGGGVEERRGGGGFGRDRFGNGDGLDGHRGGGVCRPVAGRDEGEAESGDGEHGGAHGQGDSFESVLFVARIPAAGAK